jgi:hypothetical protein
LSISKLYYVSAYYHSNVLLFFSHETFSSRWEEQNIPKAHQILFVEKILSRLSGENVTEELLKLYRSEISKFELIIQIEKCIEEKKLIQRRMQQLRRHGRRLVNISVNKVDTTVDEEKRVLQKTAANIDKGYKDASKPYKNYSAVKDKENDEISLLMKNFSSAYKRDGVELSSKNRSLSK